MASEDHKARHWSTTAKPSARKYVIKKCLRVSPVLGHANLLEDDEQWEFFKLWHHVQLRRGITHILGSDVMRTAKGFLVKVQWSQYKLFELRDNMEKAVYFYLLQLQSSKFFEQEHNCVNTASCMNDTFNPVQ